MLSSRVIFLLVLLLGCTASQSAPAEDVVEPWRLDLSSSGGIHGRGAGTFALHSDGAVAVTTMAGQKCEARADAATMRRFAEALAQAKPDRWAASYKPENCCCDRYEWVLTFEQAGKKWETNWVEEPKPMPKDLQAIVEAFRLLRTDYECR